jgi:hypothetical protein
LPKPTGCTLIDFSEEGFMTQFEYRGFRMTAEQTAAGWRIEVVHRDGGQARETETYPDLSDAIDEAKNMVDRPG